MEESMCLRFDDSTTQSGFYDQNENKLYDLSAIY